VETWQGALEDGCGVPVEPHDGSTAGAWSIDAAGANLRLDGVGSFLGVPKAVNGAELTAPAEAPAFVSYKVVELVGDNMTVRIDYGGGCNWKLDFAGVGPAEGDTTWWSIADTGPDGPRACWFDDLYAFGRDGSFANVQGDETWIEIWQGAVEDGCDAPVAPHDGSNNAIFEYDEEGATLKLTAQGAHLGVSKAANGVELTAPEFAPGSVTYKVAELVGDNMTVRVDYGTRPGGALPTQVLTAHAPAGSMISITLAVTAPSRTSRTVTRGWKSGRVLSRMVVAFRLSRTTAAPLAPGALMLPALT
jgi:hypothetical protein